MTGDGAIPTPERPTANACERRVVAGTCLTRKTVIARLQLQAVWIATLGMSLAMAKIRPVRVDITQHRNSSHPPSAFRALWLNSQAIANMREWLPYNDERTRRQIAKHALVQANALTVLPYDETQACFDGCLSREGLVSKLNQTGIRTRKLSSFGDERPLSVSEPVILV